ncbi:MAG TPA: AAA family ATPase [Clostridiales bacterium]|jgi:uridine kinase|nr:AAA family ATPase [Clostridiales bacterium]
MNNYNQDTWNIIRKNENTLGIIFTLAVKKILGNQKKVFIEHSINKGLYVELNISLNKIEENLDDIKYEMNKIIEENLSIEKKVKPKDEAIEIFKSQCMMDKVKLFNTLDKENFELYKINGYFFNINGPIFDKTGEVNKFDIKLEGRGIVLTYPRKDTMDKIPEYIKQEKLLKIFRESENWAQLIGIKNVGELNQHTLNDDLDDIVRISEALHEKKIAQIADEICQSDSKIILIAGPSSSGKTTFSQRLGVQLRVNGKKFHTVGLDDYFVERHLTPKDEEGNYDYDTIDALDLELFNEHLKQLLSGEEVVIPSYSFKTGKRNFDKKPIKISSNEYLIIEGIHGLNEKLTKDIDKKDKYKIYISALTQLNVDNHNRISTTDLRLLRRMIRDSKYRGYDAATTLDLWNNVRKGEEKYIFPFQENADVMFNSSLIYELAVLKKHALKVLEGLDDEGEFASEKKRLIEFLNYIVGFEEDFIIPNTSIIKEFIGGSCFRERTH